MTKTGERLIKSAKQAAEMADNKAILEIVYQKHAALDRVAELEQHVEALKEKNDAETCACSYDELGDVCLGHSPMLEKSNLRVAELEVELAAIPTRCDGNEQNAFEAWAKIDYNLAMHPLHYIFMDSKTNAARMGWNAAIDYVNAMLKAAKGGET